MVAVADGHWVKELSLPPGGYEYRFVVNGEWVDAPNAKETVSNPHGGVNAVGLRHDKHRFQQENQPDSISDF